MYPSIFFVNMSNKKSFTFPDSAYSSGSDLNGSGGGSNVNTNKGQEIEYWAHQHQWFETGKLTTAKGQLISKCLFGVFKFFKKKPNQNNST